MAMVLDTAIHHCSPLFQLKQLFSSNNADNVRRSNAGCLVAISNMSGCVGQNDQDIGLLNQYNIAALYAKGFCQAVLLQQRHLMTLSRPLGQL
ncbi:MULTISPECIES: hypothetical protein [unclassified Oceanobacter]|jgi:hypothetical protein|uniref:hypothetical protein n=1 Tax=unclassified Oceanobacter TaxID=2620260 RepID=UPI0027344CD1|nr:MULTISPECIES: hypothetical protein [unclassified Oceanobacter]MDP2505903.1 hypothetical protein [Oceanobacter sp. 3_MG-2023]MDP2608381.1 hypothetical protein [Oceanobacter sp. 1_MG-2023]MDP2611476.1 hypothetical protein [Oceanobacter sp. 2_MG-2023]